MCAPGKESRDWNVISISTAFLAFVMFSIAGREIAIYLQEIIAYIIAIIIENLSYMISVAVSFAVSFFIALRFARSGTQELRKAKKSLDKKLGEIQRTMDLLDEKLPRVHEAIEKLSTKMDKIEDELKQTGLSLGVSEKKAIIEEKTASPGMIERANDER